MKMIKLINFGSMTLIRHKIQILMNILDHQEVLEHQFHLLNQDGPALSNFCLSQLHQSLLFIPPSEQIQESLQAKFHISAQTMKTCETDTNSSFQIFTCVLLKIFFEQQQNPDMLQHLKCILYSPSLNINLIKNKPNRQLTSNCMKKILVQFFQIMQYNNGTVQNMLNKYPIVLQIFTLFFRTILKQMNINKIQDFREPIESHQVINILCDYFDLDYQISKGLYLLQEGEFFIYIDSEMEKAEKKDIVYGYYKQKNHENMETVESQQPKHLFEDRFQNQFNFNMGESQTLENPQVKDSNLISTPCFVNIQEDQVNFNKKCSIKLKKQDEIEEIMEQDEDDHDEKRRRTESNLNEQLNLQNSLEIKQIMTKSEVNKQALLSSIYYGSEIKQTQYNKTQKLKKQYSHEGLLNHLRNQNQRTRSDFFSKQQPKLSQNQSSFKNIIDASFLSSCLCSQMRCQKNTLQSNVIDISVVPEKALKAHSTSIQQSNKMPQTNYQLEDHKIFSYSKEIPLTMKEKAEKRKLQKKFDYKANQKTYKMPEFLSKKFNSRTEIRKEKKQKMKTEPVQTSSFEPTPQKIRKPKIVFTYTKNNSPLENEANKSLKNNKTCKEAPVEYSKKTSIREMREHFRMPSEKIRTFDERNQYRKQGYHRYIGAEKNNY